MTTVYFDAPWTDADGILEQLRPQSPDCAGSWGSISATVDPSVADYHVAFNRPSAAVDENKLLLFCREPPTSNRCVWTDVESLRAFPNDEGPMPQIWWVEKTYDELHAASPLAKSQSLSWITSDKGRGLPRWQQVVRRLLLQTEYKKYDSKGMPYLDDSITDGHILRMDLLDDIATTDSDLLDLYGRGDFPYDCYRGPVSDKWDGLADYRYTLAIENYKGPHYFSEKVADALLAWCVPIYWGCANLETYLPENSFVRVDIEDESATERIANIAQSDYRERHLDAIAEARRRILDTYQVWPRIEAVIRSVESAQ